MIEQQRSVEELVKRVIIHPGLIDKVKDNPIKELQELATQIMKELPQQRQPLEHDVWIYRMVVGALGAVVLSAVIGAIVLAVTATTSEPKNIPELLTAIGAAAVGALAGLLAPSPVKK